MRVNCLFTLFFKNKYKRKKCLITHIYLSSLKDLVKLTINGELGPLLQYHELMKQLLDQLHLQVLQRSHQPSILLTAVIQNNLSK
ncbi:hypothetical protein HanIR_Chr09g0438141 [Helianthus annuus]|nr:hypothetical protein HanIR_Chr09g0438141 [Helianthus annuus]